MRVSQNFIENISNSKKLKYYVEDDIYALKIIFRILYQNQLEGNIGTIFGRLRVWKFHRQMVAPSRNTIVLLSTKLNINGVNPNRLSLISTWETQLSYLHISTPVSR